MNKKIGCLILLTVLFITLGAVSASDVSDDTILDTPQHESIEQVQYDTNSYTKLDNNIITKKSNNKLYETKEADLNNDTESELNLVDYYVSDSEGNDENSGTKDAPFKTVGAAIDKTSSDSTYNIYILEGIYKGEGNTNLTVPGDYHINFIGSGINKTIFDGEANFTLPGSGNDAWGGSAFWNYWSNVSGNWIMNITIGSGEITITNFTIQNAWSNSGSSITACPTATIDNHATLNATNIYFDSNHAGSGAGIRNSNTSTLFVDNCIFTNGTKAQSTGNYGAAIYNNGTAVIINSQIINNYARWGSVTNDKNITMINCTFKDNHAYDGGSGYKNGPSFTTDTGITNFFMMYAVYNITSNLINCTFDNNAQCDISNAKGDLVVDGCTFNHSTGIFLFPNNNRFNTYVPTQNITNNVFMDMQPSTEFATTITSTTPSVAIRSLSTYNVTIENNTIDVPNVEYGYGLYLAANANVINNTINNYVYLSGQNNTLINNSIKTDRENTIVLTNAAINNTIVNNTLIGGYTSGDLSIGNVLASTTVENNNPNVGTYEINDDNYNEYFDENFILKNDVVTNGSKLVFINNLTNKYFIFDNIKVAVDVNTTLYNTTIITQNNARVVFNNLKILNTKIDEDYVILFESEGNTIKNANIQVTSDKPAQIIKIEEDNNIITGSTINATIPSSDIKWNSDYSIGNVPTAGIFIRSSNNRINNTRLYVTSLTSDENSYYPTVDGVDIQSKKVGEYVTGNEIRNSRINVTGGSYVYGLNIARAEKTSTPLSYYDVTSNNYAAAIQIGDSKNNNISGYVYSKANNTAYGYYSTAMASGIVNNSNISALYLQQVEAPTVVGILLQGVSNSVINSGTHNLFGQKVSAIEIESDWMNNNPENINITRLIINNNGENDTSAMIKITNSNNIYINGSTIKTTSGKGIEAVNSTNVSVTNNYLNVANLIGGDNAVKSDIEATIFNNTPTICVLTDETYSNFFDENNTFYVNGDIVSLGGNLHDKILRFTNITKNINITNAGDYTMYNSTIILSGESSVYTGSTLALNVDKINFENTNKPVFIDELFGTNQKNVKFTNSNITVTGEDIVAFDALNNNSYIYLDISTSNINMNGNNVVAVNYSGYNRGQPVYVHDNNININATEKAMAVNAEYAALQINNNNITINSNEAVALNLFNTSYSYYNLRGNDIVVTADNAIAINMTKGDTYYAYMDQNKIRIKTSNPTTAIIITGPRTIYVQNNEVIVDSENGEVPVVNVTVPSSYVRNNYIVSKDTSGNDAVAQTGVSISNNVPSESEYGVTIKANYDNWTATQENNLTLEFTNDFDESITGNVVVTVNGKEVEVTDNTIKYTPSNADEVVVKVTYSDPNGRYATTTETFNVEVNKVKSEIDLTVLSETIINKTTSIVIMLNDEFDNRITNNKVTIVKSDESETLTIKSGVLIYKFTPTELGEETITVTFESDDTYEESSESITINVTEDKDKLIDELNKKLEELTKAKNTTLTIDEVTNAKYTNNVTIKGILFNEDGLSLTGQTVIMNVNGKDVELTTKNGEFEYTTTFKSVGEQTITVIYEGNDKYSGTEESITFNVEKQDTTITLDDIESVAYGDNVTVTGTLTDINGRVLTSTNVVVTVNGKSVKAKTDSTGVFTASVKAGDVGEQTVTVTYAGNARYAESTTEATFTVDKQDVIITVDPISETGYGSNAIITGTVTDANGKALVNTNVKVTVNGKTYTAKTDSTGAFEVSVLANTIGTNDVTVSYTGNVRYAQAEATATLTVVEQDVELAVTSAELVDGTVTITGTFKDANGKALTNSNIVITINGKRYNVKTDSTGVFTFTGETTESSVTFTLSYAGSARFNAITTDEQTLSN